MKPDLNTEQKILEAARIVFQKKGMAGARMLEIAEEAGINKALLHYYFRNKEQLFQAVFSESLGKMAGKVNEIFNSDIPLFDKIEAFVDNYIKIIVANPYLPAFIIHEMNQNPEKFKSDFIGQKLKPNPNGLLRQLKKEVKAGKIRPVSPLHFMLNLISLCVFPFIAKPMFMNITGINEKEFSKLIRERKKEVTEFIIHSIKP